MRASMRGLRFLLCLPPCSLNFPLDLIRHKDLRRALKAVDCLGGSVLRDGIVEVRGHPYRCCKVFVERIPYSTKWWEVKNHFNRAGVVEYVHKVQSLKERDGIAGRGAVVPVPMDSEGNCRLGGPRQLGGRRDVFNEGEINCTRRGGSVHEACFTMQDLVRSEARTGLACIAQDVIPDGNDTPRRFVPCRLSCHEGTHCEEAPATTPVGGG